MKFRKLTHGLMCISLFAGSAAVVRGAVPKQETAAAPEHAMHGQSQADKLKAAVDELDLTDDQKAKLGPIFKDAKSKGDAVKADTTLSPDEKKAKMKEIGAELHSKVHAVLTPAQQAQLKAKMQAAKQPSGM